MKQYKIISLTAEDGNFDTSLVNSLVDDGWQIQEVKMTSAATSHCFKAWQTFVLYKLIRFQR